MTTLKLKIDNEFVFQPIVELLQNLVDVYNEGSEGPFYIKIPCFVYLSESKYSETLDYNYIKINTKQELLNTIISSTPVGCVVKQ